MGQKSHADVKLSRFEKVEKERQNVSAERDRVKGGGGREDEYMYFADKIVYISRHKTAGTYSGGFCSHQL